MVGLLVCVIIYFLFLAVNEAGVYIPFSVVLAGQSQSKYPARVVII